jgi:hypothetical protein
VNAHSERANALLGQGEFDLITRSGLFNNRSVNHYRGENDAASKKGLEKK